MTSATVTLTNAKSGDSLAVNGTLPPGISSNIDHTTAGVITVTLSGSASKAAYDAALNQIVFSSSTNPDTTDRLITVVVNDGLANSNTATSTIHVVDATPPNAPSTPDLIAASDSGSSSTDNITNVTTPTFAGTAEAGSTVTIFSDGVAVGSGTATAGGNYSITTSALNQATHSITAKATDAAGNVSGASAGLSVTIDTTADANPLLALSAATATGGVNAAAVSISLSGIDSDIASGTITLFDGNHTAIHTLTAIEIAAGSVTLGSGAFTNFATLNHADNAITVSASLTDAAGNSAAPSSTSFKLDTTADASPLLALSAATATGGVNASAVSITLSGIDSDFASGTITLSDGSGHTATHTLTTAEITAGSVTLGSGAFTNFANLNHADNTITVSASVTDDAGNTAAPTNASFTLDTTADASPLLALSAATATGGVNAAAVSITLSGIDSDFASGTITLSDGSNTATHTLTTAEITAGSVTLGSGTFTNFANLNHADNTITVSASVTDDAGNTAAPSNASFKLDTTADAAPAIAISSVTSSTNNNNFSGVTLTVGGFDSDLSSVTITLTDEHSHTATHTLTGGELATATSNGSVPISNWTGITNLLKGDIITAAIQVNDDAGNTVSHSGTFSNKNGLLTAPAGATGEPINLALTDLTDHIGTTSITLAGVPSGWTLSEGTDNADGTWTVVTSDVASLTITSPSTYTGALVLNVAETWTNADGSIGHATVADNVEAYAPGSPIFALSGDDHLTASSGHDLLVFSQPIGNDTIYNFDPSADQIDLIGYNGLAGFSDVQAHTADDGAGNAVITLGDGQSITLHGVDASSLTANDFVFDQTPVTENPGSLVISDGAILPLSGTIDNTGTIELSSTGNETDLQLIEHGITLEGHGQVILSDSIENVIFGTSADVTLTNVDNTISGAGQLGEGQLVLINEGTIIATGTNSLTIDTGTNVVVNSGTLEATGSGGLVINSDVINSDVVNSEGTNSGLLWANGGNIVVNGNVSGGGSALIGGSATLEIGGASSVEAKFDFSGLGTLKLDHAANFTGSVSGLASGDQLDLHDILFGAATTMNYTANQVGDGGTLSVSDGTHTANIGILGQYSGAGFTTSADNGGGTVVAYHDPHSLV